MSADGLPLRVSVLIVNFNSGPHLARCLDHLAAQTLGAFEAILVDNASSDTSMALAQGSIAALGARIRVVMSADNLGFAGGNNLAASHAQGQWIACLNPDAFTARDWLEQLVRAAERSGAQMAGSLQLWDGHPGQLDGSGDAYHISGIAWRGLRGKPVGLAPQTGETFAPCAAASLYCAAMFKAAGGFDERYFAYHEDVDLAFRLRLAGARAIQVQEARVSHVSSGLPGSASSLAVRLGTRNRIWTYVKCMPGWLVLGLAPLHAAAVFLSLTRDVRRGRGGAALTGIGEALSGLGPILASRRDVQKARKARLVDILRVLTWSPTRLAKGEADVRPWQA